MIKPQNARKWLGKGECTGDYMCACCGCTRASALVSRRVKTTFTDIGSLIKYGSEYISDSCMELYECKDMRFKSIFSDSPGKYRIPERSEILEILSNPPNEYVLSVPYSCKKHHWLYAGISTPERAEIGTDDRTVVIDYRTTDIPLMIENIKYNIYRGVPRDEITSGNYSLKTIDRFPDIFNFESEFEKLRPCGAMELFVKFTPACKEKLTYEKPEENKMLTTSEINAVNFLSSIAENSQFRIENGIQFWSGFFERRINRFKSYDIKEFTEKLTQACSTREGLWCNMLKDLSNSELEGIMQEIRLKTHIIVAITYSERNKKS